MTDADANSVASAHQSGSSSRDTQAGSSRPARLRLQIFVPTKTVVDQPVRKIVAEAPNGAFCLLPRHIDCVAPLVPGILSFLDSDGRERFVAVDVGTLVKAHERVCITTQNAVIGDDLERLSDTVMESFLRLETHELEARSALARLEAGTLRRFAETEEMH